MEAELDSIVIDLKSDKLRVRGKAFAKFHQLLLTKLDDLQAIIENHDILTWSSLFTSAHHGILQQGASLYNSEKVVDEYNKEIKIYTETLISISQSASNESVGIPYMDIVQFASDVFNDEGLNKYFGHAYLTLLQKSLLNPRNNLTAISTFAWKYLLERMIKLMRSSRHNLRFTDLSACTYDILELGCSYSYLHSELMDLKIFAHLESIFQKRMTEDEQIEILAIAYQVCKNMIVEHRENVCTFIDKSCEYLKRFFRKNDLSEKLRTVRIKFLDIILIAHFPFDDDKCSYKSLETSIPNQQNWVSLMSECENFMKHELALSLSKYRDKHSTAVNQVLAQCAARFSYYYYWNNDFREISNEDDQPTCSKRARLSCKIDAMSEQIKPDQMSLDKFNWKWFTVFVEMIANHSKSLNSEDIPKVLKILNECQSSVEHNFQVYTFTKCCNVLLQSTDLLEISVNKHVNEFCKTLWFKIADETLRICSGNNKIAYDFHPLLQLLIRYEKFPTSSFIESVLKSYTNNTTLRNDTTLNTLIVILKTFNLDSLPNGKELASTILRFAFQKHTVSALKRLIASENDKPSYSVLSELATCCCLIKTDVINFSKKYRLCNDEMIFDGILDLKAQKEYKVQIEGIMTLMSKKWLKTLILEDKDFLNIKQLKENLSFVISKDIECIIDQSLFEELMRLTEFRMKTISEDNSLEEIRDYICDILENNELMMNLASTLINYSALNEEKLNACFITKKIDFHVQEIERLFTLLHLKQSSFDMIDTFNILKSLHSIFGLQYHPVIGMRVREANLRLCFNWIVRQIDNDFDENNDEKLDETIGYEEFVNAKNYEKIRYLAITTLGEYFFYGEGVNSRDIIVCLKNIDFYMNVNMDIHALLDILIIFGRQEQVPHEAVKWIWNGIINLCKCHQGRLYIMKRLIENADGIIKFSREYSDMTSNIITVLRSFSTGCSMLSIEKRRYNPHVAVIFLDKFRHFHQNYFKLCFDESHVQVMYTNVVYNFLNSKTFEIQIAAIKCFSSIMQFDIDVDFTPDDMKIISTCRNDIYKIFKNDMEKEENDFKGTPYYFQLYTSLFCANFHLRKPMIFEISKLFCRQKLTDPLALDCFGKILSFLKCNVNSLMDSNNMLHLISKWIVSEYHINKFPWYFTGSSSHEEFVETNYKLLVLALLKNKCNLIHEFVSGCGNENNYTVKGAIYEVITDCYAFIIPIEAGCEKSDEYKAKTTPLQLKINAEFKKSEQQAIIVENLPQVMTKILVNVIDDDKFQNICGFWIEFHRETETLNLVEYEQCINYLKAKCGASRNENLMTFLCHNKKSFVEQLFMLQRSRVQATELKEHKLMYLLQYCILVESTFEYMNDEKVEQNESVKKFLIREIVSYFGFLIKKIQYGEKFRETAANFLFFYLKQILPFCVEEFKPQMIRIMADLLTIVNNVVPDTAPMRSICFEIIKFVVLKQSGLSDVVAQLDRFPSQNEFNEFRQYQHEIKYSVEEFSLVDEIKHFMSVKNRQREGLTELSEHLAAKKIELKKLFEAIPQDGSEGLLHKLLHALVGYIQGSFDDRSAIEAIKCLGEIGSHNLSKIVFNADDALIYETVENVQHCQRLICFKFLDQMENLLIDSNHEIIESASLACHHIFSTLSSQGYPESPYLRPFVKSDESKNIYAFYLDPKIDKTLELKAFFEKYKAEPFTVWLRRLCTLVMNFAGDKVLHHIIYFKPSFAEIIFSLIIQLPLHYDREEINAEILSGLNYFFDQCNTALNYKEKTNEGSIFIDKKAIREMLKFTEAIRMHCQNNQKSRMAQMLNLNYLHIARAAKHCEAFFTALMYCEIWAQKEIDDDKNKKFCELIKNKTLQDVMYHSYHATGINDTNDLYLNPFTERSLYLQTTGQLFQKILEAENNGSDAELTQVCEDIGLYHLLSKFNSSSENQNKSKQYDCLWRLNKWDLVVETETELKDENGLIDYQGEFNKYHYLSLQSIKKGDELATKAAVDKSRSMFLQLLSQKSLECSNTLYKFLESAHQLVQIEDFAEVHFKRVHNSHEKLLMKWSSHDELPFDYEQYEKILMQRLSILDTSNIRSGRRTWIPIANKSNLLLAIREAIAAGCLNDAYRKILKISSIESLSVSDRMEILIEESKLSMHTDVNLAKKCLQKILEEKETENDFVLKSTANRLYGEILAENYSASISDINKNHFEKSLKYLNQYAKYHKKEYLIPNVDNIEQMTQLSQKLLEENDCEIDKKISDCTSIFDTTAKYFDREYINKCAYINSMEYTEKKKTCEKNQKIIDQMNRDGKLNMQNVEIKKAYAMLTRSTNLDIAEIKSTEAEKKLAAKNALYNYFRSIIQKEDNDILNIFRIISLMLENFESLPFYKDFLTKNLLIIPTYKFIVALPQLTVRLSNNNDMLTELLKNLIERCAIDHPHHTLPILLALVNSNADMDKNQHDLGEEPRVTGAKQLWAHLKLNKGISKIMDQLEKISLALIDLAYFPATDYNQIPPRHKVLTFRNMDNLQCPTLDLLIRKNGVYTQEALTTISRWEPGLTNVGGINAPKKIKVLCSDGITRPQLLKGKDDMRQDAIMQQIFGVVNQLLMLNKDMKKKQARIRTYKVVPFSRRSGILEWCSDTTPVGLYLVGNRKDKGAHEKYRPNDWNPTKAMREIVSVDSAGTEKKLEKYVEVCKNIKPVFQHFFYEHFKSPGRIFERRFAYTVSLAVSSMIGYILGIGDRHVQNILIDFKTAEVIHIDFGIAFEAGKCLPHPELIPFRLSRDFIAPLGVSGVDGIFRKTCEKTIEILRENEKTIATILEVLLYDPMYAWSIGAKHARRRQLECEDVDDTASNDEGEKHDAMASRALQRVQAKLKGFADDSSVRYPSIDGQVQYLIQAATNPVNLSKLFRGWQAYL